MPQLPHIYKKTFLETLPPDLSGTPLRTEQVSGDRPIIGWRPRTAQPKYWIDMPQRFFILVSHKSCRARAFGCDLVARNLAHVEVGSGNAHGEGRTCAA